MGCGEGCDIFWVIVLLR